MGFYLDRVWIFVADRVFSNFVVFRELCFLVGFVLGAEAE